MTSLSILNNISGRDTIWNLGKILNTFEYPYTGQGSITMYRRNVLRDKSVFRFIL